MNRSVLIAVGVVLAAGLWLLSGVAAQRDEAAAIAAPARGQPAEPQPARVRVRDLDAAEKLEEIVVQGRTRASRRALLKAETSGRVVELPVAEGRTVAAGEVLARLAMNDREARLAEARALVARREIEHRAASQLSERDFASRTKLAEAEAELEAARARLAAARLEVERTRLVAPFDGTLQKLAVEVGDFVAPSGEVATLLDLSPLVVVGDVSERDVGAVRLGAAASVRFVDGRSAQGSVTYVSASADPGTRTFAVEVEIDNPDGAVPEGLTTELRIPKRRVAAHLVSPAALTLDDGGRIGVKIVEEGRVSFREALIVGDGPDGVWVTGLPDRIRLITVGQEFVRTGDPVIAVPEGGNAS